jgi:hypothetical protein
MAMIVALVLLLCPQPGAPSYTPDLGTYTFAGAVSLMNSTPFVTGCFNRALIWQYGFNQPSALREAQRAINANPSCALCHMAKAYSLGPFLNRLFVTAAESDAAFRSMQSARQLLAAEPPGSSSMYSRKERGVLRAFAARHPSSFAGRSDAPPGAIPAAVGTAFYQQMCTLAAELATDADTWAWCAEGLMVVQRLEMLPWVYYLDAHGTPTPLTANATAALETAMRLVNYSHPLVNHLYIHITESSPVALGSGSTVTATGAARANGAADALEGQAPGSGHLQHMPGHTYAREGRWKEYAAVNLHENFSVGTHAAAPGAHVADETAAAHQEFAYGATHNLYAGVHGAQTDGQLSLALFGAAELRHAWTSAGSAECGRGGGPGMDAGFNVALLIYVRYAMWSRILAQDTSDPYPQPSAVDCPLTASLRHYARGMARAGMGERSAAASELESMRSYASKIHHSYHRGNDPGVFKVATLMLRARLALPSSDGASVGEEGQADATGDGKQGGGAAVAVDLLEQAVQEQERWGYSEPPLWYCPVRECLAEVLLNRVGDAPGALSVIEAQRPTSAWTMRGRAEALRRQQQPQPQRREGARVALNVSWRRAYEAVEGRATVAWARADVAVRCCCCCCCCCCCMVVDALPHSCGEE